VGSFSIDLLSNKTKTFPNSEDVGIDWEGFPPHAKKKETMDSFWTNPFELFKGLVNLFGIHLF